ncbi:MAG: hypothetical protein M3342_08305 [Bacteroidota bacterium]|nr:hypothetical protein [Bacteroidota bacterium]
MASKSFLQHNTKYFLSDRQHYFYLRYSREKGKEDQVLLCTRKGKEEIIIYNEPLNQRNRFQLIDEFEKRLGIQGNTQEQ